MISKKEVLTNIARNYDRIENEKTYTGRATQLKRLKRISDFLTLHIVNEKNLILLDKEAKGIIKTCIETIERNAKLDEQRKADRLKARKRGRRK